jgi:hypothetical protein
MCAALIGVADVSDASSELLVSMASSLTEVFAPDEVTTTINIAICSKALTQLSKLVLRYLGEFSSLETADSVAGVLSLFTTSSSRYASADSNSTLLAVEDGAAALLQGITDGLVGGEDPASVVSDSIRLIVQNDLVYVFVDKTFTPPASDAETAYGILQPTLTLKGSVFQSGCDFTSGDGGTYVAVSTLKWATDPYQGVSVASPLLRFSSSSQSSSDSTAETSRRRQLFDASLETAATTYVMTHQFSTEQNLTYLNATRSGNHTYPACIQRQISATEYSGCSDCNVTSYTNWNVTVSCSDMGQLCPTTATKRRRRLDEDSTESSEGSDTTVATYGTLVFSVYEEVSTVLTGNPFEVNIKEAAGALALTLSVILSMVVGLVYFAKWDRVEREELLKKKKEMKKKDDGDMQEAVSAKLDKSDEEEEEEEAHRDDDEPIGEAGKQWGDGASSVALGSPGTRKAGPKPLLDDNDAKTIIHNFFRVLLPDATVFYDHEKDRGSRWRRLLLLIVDNHVLTMMFSSSHHLRFGASRVMRFLNFARSILILLFVDTVFYGVFYPSDSTCVDMTTQATCLEQPSKIASDNTLCQWTLYDEASAASRRLQLEEVPHKPFPSEILAGPEGYCEMAPIPSDVMFLVVLALLTTILSTPIDLLVQSIQDRIAGTKPVWSLSALRSKPPGEEPATGSTSGERDSEIDANLMNYGQQQEVQEAEKLSADMLRLFREGTTR